jgi:hypothetical protein
MYINVVGLQTSELGYLLLQLIIAVNKMFTIFDFIFSEWRPGIDFTKLYFGRKLLNFLDKFLHPHP